MSRKSKLVSKSVTPDLAEEWLAIQFDGQRKLRDHHVYRLAVDMESGNFVPHNAITFARVDSQLYLVDGQHRLKAVELYGKPVEMSVLEISANSLQDVRAMYGNIDQGLKRTNGDAIRAAGLPEEFGLPGTYLQRASAALRTISTAFIDPTGGISVSDNRRRRSATRSNAINAMLVRHWQKEICLYHDITSNSDPDIRRLFLRAPVLACAFLTLRYRPEKAKEFWEEASKDDSLGMYDPRKKFVNWIRERTKGEKSGYIARGFSRFWQKFLEGGEVRQYSTPDMRSHLKIEGVDFQNIEDDIKKIMTL